MIIVIARSCCTATEYLVKGIFFRMGFLLMLTERTCYKAVCSVVQYSYFLMSVVTIPAVSSVVY